MQWRTLGLFLRQTKTARRGAAAREGRRRAWLRAGGSLKTNVSVLVVWDGAQIFGGLPAGSGWSLRQHAARQGGNTQGGSTPSSQARGQAKASISMRAPHIGTPCTAFGERGIDQQTTGAPGPVRLSTTAQLPPELKWPFGLFNQRIQKTI